MSTHPSRRYHFGDPPETVEPSFEERIEAAIARAEDSLEELGELLDEVDDDEIVLDVEETTALVRVFEIPVVVALAAVGIFAGLVVDWIVSRVRS